MRLGYSYWGFLGDHRIVDGKEASTPDGNFSYSWTIAHEAHRRGWRVFAMQQDRDSEGMVEHGEKKNFLSHSQPDRRQVYNRIQQTHGQRMPELDVLLLEWRFPIPGRNELHLEGEKGFQPDLLRQVELLRHYKNTGTKIIAWDLDHKLRDPDVEQWEFDAVFEPSNNPGLSCHTIRADIPCCIDQLDQHPMLPPDDRKKLVYVGNRYERDDVIDEYIRPVSERFPGQVRFYGNWTKPKNHAVAQTKWPHIEYRDRIPGAQFIQAYGGAGCVPLLGKRCYMRAGQVSQRAYEAVLFGSIPVGLAESVGIEGHVYQVARDAHELGEIADWLSHASVPERNRVRQETIDRLSIMHSPRVFLDQVERVGK